ncbi:hypothetical protein B5V01_27800 [Mesorhizobium erdmanii]|uniref:Transposase IS110-like N-terminal domain-containing protein n=2 Tax=Mesorhizobium TaxID=68287 RepID=A0A3M9X145_9HYPH|nr:hypothetical protein DNR46_35105 [Mesorhizobium japonicum]RXT37921.1 hypothetical protein B5V01_27800 [Mesorhizobium erdmanii]
MPKITTGDRPELKPVNVGAAGIDIGSKMHMAAVDPGCTDTPVRAFGTFTQDLHDLTDWFKACGVTGVRWNPPGSIGSRPTRFLSGTGFEIVLVNARYAKNVPGRKTDVSDAAWLRQFHSYGLLRGSFRPDAEIATLRAYLRQRERLVEYGGRPYPAHAEGSDGMNLQLHHVVSEVTGATGMRIIRAIVAGERNPDILATYRDVRCHSSIETIRAALVGNDRDEHVFALTQSLELYDTYQCTRAAAASRSVCVISPRMCRSASTMTTAWLRPSVSTGSRLIAGALAEAVAAVDVTVFTTSAARASSLSPTAPTSLVSASTTGSVRML